MDEPLLISRSRTRSHVVAGPAEYQRTLLRDGPAALAKRFRHATNDLIGFVSGLSDEQWIAVDTVEGLSIGAMVHHVAAGDRLTRSVLEAMAAGADRPAPETDVATEDRERLQAQEAADFADLSRMQTIEMLQRQSAEVARTIRGLSSTDLDRIHTFWGETVLMREFIQRWIEDIGLHLAEIRATAGSHT
jgi:hypothetical protein